MIFAIFLIVAVGFVGYAIIAHYGSTPSDQSRAHRVWLSILAAFTAIGAAVSALFHTPGAIP